MSCPHGIDTTVRDCCACLRSDLSAAQERERGMREALAFYASEESWKKNDGGGGYWAPSDAVSDGGKKARAALSGKDGTR